MAQRGNVLCSDDLEGFLSPDAGFTLRSAGIVSALLADYLVTPGLFKMFRIFGREKEDASRVNVDRKIA